MYTPIVYACCRLCGRTALFKERYSQQFSTHGGLREAINDPRLSIAMILIRRLGSKIYYRYLGNQNFDEAAETWSSSKIFCESAAAQRLRVNTCTHESGLDSFTDGKHGLTPLGDLSTIIASYDRTAGYTSNSLAAYFGVALAGRQRLNTLLNSWLAPGPNNETLDRIETVLSQGGKTLTIRGATKKSGAPASRTAINVVRSSYFGSTAGSIA